MANILEVQAKIDQLTFEVDFYENLLTKGGPGSAIAKIKKLMEEAMLERQVLFNLDVIIPEEMNFS